MTPHQIIRTMRQYGYTTHQIATLLVQLGHKAPR